MVLLCGYESPSIYQYIACVSSNNFTACTPRNLLDGRFDRARNASSNPIASKLRWVGFSPPAARFSVKAAISSERPVKNKNSRPVYLDPFIFPFIFLLSSHGTARNFRVRRFHQFNPQRFRRNRARLSMRGVAIVAAHIHRSRRIDAWIVDPGFKTLEMAPILALTGPWGVRISCMSSGVNSWLSVSTELTNVAALPASPE